MALTADEAKELIQKAFHPCVKWRVGKTTAIPFYLR
jgi:hypothetical protein